MAASSSARAWSWQRTPSGVEAQAVVSQRSHRGRGRKRVVSKTLIAVMPIYRKAVPPDRRAKLRSPQRTSPRPGVSRVGVNLAGVAAEHSLRDRSSHRGRLTIVFALVITAMVLEVVVGLLTHSLALLADAGHMATDALGLGMALAAMTAADKTAIDRHRTFGLYRIEILAALANAVLLFGVAGYVVFEAIDRFGTPVVVDTGPMLLVGIVGLAVNVLSWWLLRDAAAENLNVEGAMLEVLADLWGSIGVVSAALIVRFTGWLVVDALLAMAIAAFIVPRAYRLAARAVRILVQAAPRDMDVDDLRRQLAAIPEVIDVHDLHVWTLTSQMEVASVHLMIPDEADPHPVLDQARQLLREKHGIDHATLQVEPASHTGCHELRW